jgi:N-methylhydantoinase B
MDDQHSEALFAKSLDELPGNREPVSWGVYPLMNKDALYVRWDGGGGYGDPLHRPPEDVYRDFKNGLISQKFARDVYGVIFDGGQSGIDGAATKDYRSELFATRKSENGNSSSHENFASP